MKKYIFKEVEVDYRYWFVQQILFSLLEFCSFDKHLEDEFNSLAYYCDKFCGIPSQFYEADLIESKAYYKFRIKVD